MEVKGFDARHASLSLSHDELATISQALNEVCHGLRVDDFPSKMGSDESEVDRLLDEIIPTYYRMKQSRSRHVVVRLSARELRAIIGALREVCREIDEIEFATRMGVKRSEVDQILKEMVPIYRKMKQKM